MIVPDALLSLLCQEHAGRLRAEALVAELQARLAPYLREDAAEREPPSNRVDMP